MGQPLVVCIKYHVFLDFEMAAESFFRNINVMVSHGCAIGVLRARPNGIAVLSKRFDVH